MKPAQRTKAELKRTPRPESPAELEALTLWYFGAALHLSRLNVYGEGASYEVAELYNDYHGKGWLFGENCIRGYDYSCDFWEHVLGHLTCGGIGAHSYGQVSVRGRRNTARLKRFEEYLRQKEPGRLRKAFERLAGQQGAGENTEAADDGVLISGREDGAEAAFIGRRNRQ